MTFRIFIFNTSLLFLLNKFKIKTISKQKMKKKNKMYVFMFLGTNHYFIFGRNIPNLYSKRSSFLLAHKINKDRIDHRFKCLLMIAHADYILNCQYHILFRFPSKLKERLKKIIKKKK